MNLLKKYWDEKPLLLIVLAGALIRLLSVIFSKGFGFFDDHFLIIEAAQSWADGKDYNNWLPRSGATGPGGHNLFYTGIHFVFFRICHFLHFDDPQGKMYVVRFFHGAFSLLIITLSYRITFEYAGKRTARMVGLLLSLYWFMPMLSVRNLVEMVCIPFLLWTTWMILRAEKETRKAFYLYAGLSAGIAFAIRFQSLFFIGGFGLVLLFRKNLAGAVLFGVGALLSAFLTQGWIDYRIWGHPFAEFFAYIQYNLANKYNFETQAWYMYFTVLFGMLVPPISLFLLFGFVRNWKTHLLLFLPAVLFFAFHSYFPNKQERFILPVIPFVVIGGMIGWNEFLEKSTFWIKHAKLLHRCWIFFWVINTLPMLFISCSYSKRDRVEAMVYLSQKKDLKLFIVEATNHDDYVMPPLYYLGHWPATVWDMTNKTNCDSMYKHSLAVPDNLQANYVLFQEDENLEARVKHFRECYAEITLETVIHQGMLDAILHFLNPVNKSQNCYIYKITKKRVQTASPRIDL
jgi:hypothetical protein